MTPSILETERLSFRPMSDADEADLERPDSDPEVRAFFPGGTEQRPTSRERIAQNLASYAQPGWMSGANMMSLMWEAAQGKLMILYTTRAAAEERGKQLHAKEDGDL